MIFFLWTALSTNKSLAMPTDCWVSTVRKKFKFYKILTTDCRLGFNLKMKPDSDKKLLKWIKKLTIRCIFIFKMLYKFIFWYLKQARKQAISPQRSSTVRLTAANNHFFVCWISLATIFFTFFTQQLMVFINIFNK